MGTLRSVNPATGETLQEFEELSDQGLEEDIARAALAFSQYRRTTLSQRAGWLLRAAERLESDKHAFGRLMALEMGKTISAGIAEAEKCAWGCRYYAEHGARFLADQEIDTGAAQRSYVTCQPLGVILAIMPWNFPFWQVFRFAAPALMAGNVALLKHASNVPQCALAIENVFRRAGFPENVFKTLLIGTERVARVLEDPRVAAATLTGSEAAGSAVASTAAREIKKTVLELGGSDPFIVLPSANLDRAVQTAVNARNINNGQSCIAAKRFIVHESIADAFLQRFVKGMQDQIVGDPLDEKTQIGPLATARIRSDLHRQVEQTVEAGAQLLTGGKMIEGPGNYYPPTVLSEIPQNSPAWREELFGPVAAVFRARDLDHAISIANDSKYGLGSAVWSEDAAEQQRCIAEIEAGMVFINGLVASDPRLPFGGVKRSGYGRELSEIGIKEFVNIKTVVQQNTTRATEARSE